MKTATGIVLIILIAVAVNFELLKSGLMTQFLVRLQTPFCGESEVLPVEVLPVLNYIRKNNIMSVSVSAAVTNNRFVYQPLAESISPAVITSFKPIFISYSSENIPSNCVTLHLEKRIRIASCR